MRNIRSIDKKNIAKMANKDCLLIILTHDSVEYRTKGSALEVKADDPVGSGSELNVVFDV